MTTVPFGDKPSGTVSIVALRNTSEMDAKGYSKVVDVLMRNSHVVISVDSRAKADGIVRNIENIL